MLSTCGFIAVLMTMGPDRELKRGVLCRAPALGIRSYETFPDLKPACFLTVIPPQPLKNTRLGGELQGTFSFLPNGDTGEEGRADTTTLDRGA